MRKILLVSTLACVVLFFKLLGPLLIGHTLYAFGFPSAAAFFFEDPTWKGVAYYASGRWDDAIVAMSNDSQNSYNLGNAYLRAGRYPEALKAYEKALTLDPQDEDAAYNKSLIENVYKITTPPPTRDHSLLTGVSPAVKAGEIRDRPPLDSQSAGAGGGLASGAETQGRTSPGGKISHDGGGDSSSTIDSHHTASGAAGSIGAAGRSGDVQPNYPDLLQERESRMRRRQQEANIHPSVEWLETFPDDPGAFLRVRIEAEKHRRLNASGGPIPEDD